MFFSDQGFSFSFIHRTFLFLDEDGSFVCSVLNRASIKGSKEEVETDHEGERDEGIADLREVLIEEVLRLLWIDAYLLSIAC